MDSCGLLWWRSPEILGLTSTPAHRERLSKAGVEAGLLEPLKVLTGQFYPDLASFQSAYVGQQGDFEAYRQAILAARVPLANLQIGKNWSYAARGFLGQYLVIFPEARLVAVRLHRYREDQPEGCSFEDFEDLIRKFSQELSR